MGLRKGQTNNPKGRPAGKPNRTTTEIKSILTGFIGNNIENLQRDLDSLEPKDRLSILERLMKYIIPAQREEITDLERLSDEQLDKIIETLKSSDNG
jgi:hypothetical protein